MLATSLPFKEMSTLYLPAGNPLGSLIMKAVVCGPLESRVLLSSCTVLPS